MTYARPEYPREEHDEAVRQRYLQGPVHFYFFLLFLAVGLLTQCLSFRSPNVATAAPGITSEAASLCAFPDTQPPLQQTSPHFQQSRRRALYTSS